MADRIVLIVNPVATRVDRRLTDRTSDELRTFGLTEVCLTTHGGHAAELAREAVAAGATVIVTLGGDGTVNEVAQAVAGTEVAMAPLPGGSTNVFARAVGWPHPASRALPALASALTAHQLRTVHLGLVTAGSESRLFCVNVGVGADGETIDFVERHPWVKTRFRNAGVATAAALSVVRGRRDPHPIRVTVDGAPAFPAATLVAATGSPYTYLGPKPLDLAPGADFGSRLRWVAVHSARVGAAMGVGVGALRGGRHLRRRDVTDGWAAEEIVVTAENGVALQADGEPLGRHHRVVMSPGPGLLTLVPPVR